MKVESLFLSDVHLGQAGCRATELLAFLAGMQPKNIFVIGDLIDFHAMRRSVWWPQAHQDVLRLLLERARSGVRVVYIPGNHDEAALPLNSLIYRARRVIGLPDWSLTA